MSSETILANFCALPTLSNFFGRCLTRPYKRACHQTNFSKGEFRKEGTPFSFYYFFSLYFHPYPLCPFSFLGVPWAVGCKPDNIGEII